MEREKIDELIKLLKKELEEDYANELDASYCLQSRRTLEQLELLAKF